MPREILRKAILSALFVHILLFVAIAIPSGSPPTGKKFVRVSLYPVAGGKVKGEIKERLGMEKVERGEEIKVENISVEESKKKESVENKKYLKEEPQKPPSVKRDTQKEKKGKESGISKKEVALKRDREKKPDQGTKGQGKKSISQKPSVSEIKQGRGKGGGEEPGKFEKEGEVEEFVPEDVKAQYANVLWKTVKEKWTILSPLKGKNLKAEVLVKISSDGKIIERKIEKSSGNPTFDAIALNVIDSIESFYPPPWNPKKPVEIIFIFSSE